MLGSIYYHYFDLMDHKFTIYLQVSITTIIFPYVTRLEAHLALHQTHHAVHVRRHCKSSAFILGVVAFSAAARTPSARETLYYGTEKKRNK